MLAVRRYYVKHNKDDFQRRITMVTQAPAHLMNADHLFSRALVEYKRRMKSTERHGNAKLFTAPYTRTHPKAIERIENELKTKKRPRDVYIDMLQEDDVHCTAKRLKQVHSMKYGISRGESGNQN